MRLIERPWKTPGRCALIAHIDPVSTPTARWIDVDAVLPGWDQHVFVSDVGVRQAMSTLGYPTPLQYEAMEDRAVAAETMVDALLERLRMTEGELASIDALESLGYQKRKKPGRPAKAVA